MTDATLPTDAYLKKSPHAARVGKAVEHLVAASCILASGTELNVSTAMVDDEGVDLVFHRRGGTATLAVQVKSRSTDAAVVQKGKFLANVRAASFQPRKDLYMLFVVVDRATATLGPVWFVPSFDFDRLANLASKGMRRIVASSGPNASGRWLQYRMNFTDLPKQILSVLEELDATR
jgi:hypothetical protein